MNRKKQNGGGEELKITTIRVFPAQLEQAKQKADDEGRSLSTVIRKMIDHYLSDKYKPFDD